jgi:LysR family transcriptional regulator, regulator of abg operon
MKLNHLRHLIAVAQCGSIRAAARHLGGAQPAITRSIHEIERELGISVFERKAKGVILTPAGEIFLRRAITVQEELRRAQEEIDQYAGKTTGIVSIGLSTASHIALLPYSLERFKERYPDVFLDISEGLFPVMDKGLQNGSLDFYVGPLTESPTSKEFSIEKLFDNVRLIYGRKGHPLAGARSLQDLAAAKWIGTSVTVASDAELGPLFARAGLPPPRIEIQAHFALTMIMAAASSDLLTMLPQQWRHSPLTTALLHIFDIAESLPAPPICIVKRARLPLTPAAEFLCDMMRRAALHHNNQSARVAAGIARRPRLAARRAKTPVRRRG